MDLDKKELLYKEDGKKYLKLGVMVKRITSRFLHKESGVES